MTDHPPEIKDIKPQSPAAAGRGIENPVFCLRSDDMPAGASSSLVKIKKIIEEILAKMDFLGEVTVNQDDSGFARADVESMEARWLIGKDAENLKALQQICRVILNKKLGAAAPRFILDVNHYRQDRLDSLTRMAQNLAREVLSTNESRWLPPMSSYERRAVHLALVDFPGVKTESEGATEARQVVIKPANTTKN